MPAPLESASGSPSQPSPPKSFFAYLLGAVPFLILLSLAYRGIDFGNYWDEEYNKTDAVTYSLEHDCTLLPDGYLYPGVNYWLTFGALLPEVYKTARQVGPDATALKTALVPIVGSHAFRLRLRHVYAFIAALTTIWIYLTVLVWGGTWLEALFSSLLIATSFEVICHSRWVAADSILMQFGALTLLFLAVGWKKQSGVALRFAAVAAGLACGTKYPGALLMFPILLIPFLQGSTQGGWWRAILRCAGLGAIFGLTYLATTPGTLLQPILFYQSLVKGWNAYANGWYGYTVTPGLDHLGKILVYFATAVFSNLKLVALAFFAPVLIGFWVVIRENSRSAAIVLLFPAIYLLYFSRQESMIVRNYLAVVPFAAFLAGRGIAWVHHRCPSTTAGFGLVIVVAGLLTINLVDQIKAANSVAHRHNTARFEKEFAHYIKQRPNRVFLVSDKLIPVLREWQLWPRPNLLPASGGVQRPFDEYVAYYSETVSHHPLDWPTNRPHSFVAVFGPREVNLDYYTGWAGDDRIVSISEALVRELAAHHVVLP